MAKEALTSSCPALAAAGRFDRGLAVKVCEVVAGFSDAVSGFGSAGPAFNLAGAVLDLAVIGKVPVIGSWPVIAGVSVVVGSVSAVAGVDLVVAVVGFRDPIGRSQESFHQDRKGILQKQKDLVD